MWQTDQHLCVVLVHKQAQLPVRKHAYDAALDLFAPEGGIILPGERLQLKLGICIQVPVGTFGWIQGRSSLAIKHGITTIGNIIDAGYTGEISAILVNHGKDVFGFNRGDRIAQLLIIPYLQPVVEVVTEIFPRDERQEGGIGSTGK